jgi:fermentation-respiration switch protein FrsA (DUF1100 family)
MLSGMAKLVPPALLVAGLVLAYLAVVWFGQRPMLFPAAWLPAPSAPDLIEVVHLDGPEGRDQALFLPPAEGTPAPFPILIFAHGNGELADFWADQFGPVQEWGWGVLLYEYPGYGRTPGRPSERAIRQSALRVYDWAAQDPRIDPRRIVAYGRSLGGSVASHLAATRPIAGLILESAFTSVRPLAASYFVPRWLVRDPFDNLSALRRYRGPLLVLHGRADDLVPVEHGRALAPAVPGAEFHALPCGHNDCPRPWDLIRTFFETRGLVAAGSRRPHSPHTASNTRR